MYRQSQNLQQLCEEKKECLDQLRRKRRENMLNQKRNNNYLESWINVVDFKEYIATNHSIKLFDDILWQLDGRSVDKFEVPFIFVYRDGSNQFRAFYFTNLEHINEIIKYKVDFSNLIFVLAVYDYKFKLIFNHDELINTALSMYKFINEKFDLYKNLNQNDLKIYGTYGIDFNFNIRDIITQNDKDMINSKYYTNKFISGIEYEEVISKISNRLYFVDKYNKVQSLFLKNLTLNDIIKLYESQELTDIAISFCDNLLFFEDLNTLLLGLDYVEKYSPSIKDFCMFHSLFNQTL